MLDFMMKFNFLTSVTYIVSACCNLSYFCKSQYPHQLFCHLKAMPEWHLAIHSMHLVENKSLH